MGYSINFDEPMDPKLKPRRAPSKKTRKNVRRRVTDSSMSARGLMSRRTRKKAKRAISRMNQKAKMLACHACNRSDFITEKSLKKHTAKFHTPGAKSPRGFRTRRDPSERFDDGDRVWMKHPRGSDDGKMWGEVEDGFVLWDRGEPVKSTKLPHPDVHLSPRYSN